MISDHEDIAEYILKNYKNKVVEVGIGCLPHVALALNDKMDVLVTDVNEQKYPELRFFKDNIFAPDIDIYTDATLLYSIRPPIDMQVPMAQIARKVGADLLIRPFGNEKADMRRFYKRHEVVNYKKARFYLYKA